MLLLVDFLCGPCDQTLVREAGRDDYFGTDSPGKSICIDACRTICARAGRRRSRRHRRIVVIERRCCYTRNFRLRASLPDGVGMATPVLAAVECPRPLRGHSHDSASKSSTPYQETGHGSDQTSVYRDSDRHGRAQWTYTGERWKRQR
jgi:hypothetical protein